MSWQDGLRDASFRGVPFFVTSADSQVGRRTLLHEFPGRDQPYTEDLGLMTRRFSVEAFVLGPNYMAGRDDLRVAVEKPGPGTLVHPYWGELDVVVYGPLRVRESTNEGGMAKLTFEVVETGAALAVTVRIDTIAAVAAAADICELTFMTDFETLFAIAGLVGDIVDALVAVIQSAASTLRKIKGMVNAVLNVIDTITTAIDELADMIEDIINLPGDIARAFTNAIAAIQGSINQVKSAFAGAFGGQIVEAVDALRDAVTGEILDMADATEEQIRDAIDAIEQRQQDGDILADTLMRGFNAAMTFGPTVTLAPSTTPQRQQELACQEAFITLVETAATVESIRVASTLEFTSYTKAVEVRDELLDKLDTLAEATTSDAMYYTFADLRAAFVRHIRETAVNLPRVIEYTPAITLPALVVAHDLYGDASRNLEIVDRNGIRNPSFVPGAQALEVLSDA